jgi:hypothetical protein
MLGGEWIGARRSDYNLYDFSLGGPLWPTIENVNFYVSGERRWQADRSPSFMTSQFRQQLSDLGRDGLQALSNSSGGFSFQGKVGWQINERCRPRSAWA